MPRTNHSADRSAKRRSAHHRTFHLAHTSSPAGMIATATHQLTRSSAFHSIHPHLNTASHAIPPPATLHPRSAGSSQSSPVAALTAHPSRATTPGGNMPATVYPGRAVPRSPSTVSALQSAPIHSETLLPGCTRHHFSPHTPQHGHVCQAAEPQTAASQTAASQMQALIVRSSAGPHALTP